MNSHSMAQSEEQFAEACERRRRRTFRRTVVAFVLCIVLLGAVRVWWGIESRRRLRNEIARIRDAGAALLVDDFNPASDTSDEENAAILYDKAIAAFVDPVSGTLSLADVVGDPRFHDSHREEALAIIELNGGVLRLLRQARERERVDWVVRFKSPLVNLMFPALSAQRNLAKFGCSAAYAQFRDGDHAGAIETLRDVGKLAADITGTQRSTLINHLVATACEALVFRTIEDITPTLVCVDSSGAVPAGRQPHAAATREQIQTFIAELLDEDRFWLGLSRCMSVERATQLDSVRSILSGSFNLGALTVWIPGRTFIRPMLEMDGVFMLEHMTAAVAAARKRNWAEVDAVHAAGESEFRRFRAGESIRGMTRFLSGILLPSLSRAHLLHFRMIVSRRMAATGLAIRLFELDHGRRPESLDELVPSYLERVPADPFAAEGHVLGYRPDAAPVVLYSVGNDGRDDGGRFATKKNGAINWDVEDIVYFLDGDRPLKPARPPSGMVGSGQAVEDYSEKQVDEGDADQGDDGGEPSSSTISRPWKGILAIR